MGHRPSVTLCSFIAFDRSVEQRQEPTVTLNANIGVCRPLAFEDIRNHFSVQFCRLYSSSQSRDGVIVSRTCRRHRKLRSIRSRTTACIGRTGGFVFWFQESVLCVNSVLFADDAGTFHGPNDAYRERQRSKNPRSALDASENPPASNATDRRHAAESLAASNAPRRQRC